MPVAPLPKIRAELASTCKRMHQMGWVANHDGNISLRLTGNRLLITPTATSKGAVDAASLLIVDVKGQVLEGRNKPFSELDLHLAAYRARPEVEVVLHAHPPMATAVGLAGVALSPVAMPEIVVSLGEVIPTLPRAMPKSALGVKQVEEACAQFDAVLLQGNGALTLGANLSMAFLRMELVEHYAKIFVAARQLGPVAPLSPEELGPLLEARKKTGLGPQMTTHSGR